MAFKEFTSVGDKLRILLICISLRIIFIALEYEEMETGIFGAQFRKKCKDCANYYFIQKEVGVQCPIWPPDFDDHELGIFPQSYTCFSL